MAQVVLTDAFVMLGATEISTHTTNVAISYDAEALDATAMGADTKVFLGGVKSWTVEIEAIADEEAIGQILFDMVGTVVAFEARPTSDVAAAGNPSYEGQALVTAYTPLGGAHGELVRVSISCVSAGPLTRAVA